MRLIKWILPLIILAAAGFIFSYLKASKAQLPPSTPQERAWTVSAISVTPQTLSPQIELYAEVENPQQVTLRAAIGADVETVHLLEGERFNEGDLLVRLDTREIDLQISQQLAQLDSLKAQLETEKLRHQSDLKALEIEREIFAISERALARQSSLSDRNLSSREQLDSAGINLAQRKLNLVTREQSIADHPNRVAQLEASIAQLQAQWGRLELDRERSEIRAPFDGRISQIHVAAGDRVRSADALAQIYPARSIEVRAQLPLSILPLIKRPDNSLHNLRASAVIDGEPVKLELTRLSAEIARGSAGVDGIFRFSDPDYSPEPGRALSIELSLPSMDNLIALPPSALYGTDRIYRLNNSRMEAVSVEHIGSRRSDQGDSQVLVRSDQFNAEVQIVTTQLPNAITGMLVEVTE